MHFIWQTGCLSPSGCFSEEKLWPKCKLASHTQFVHFKWNFLLLTCFYSNIIYCFNSGLLNILYYGNLVDDPFPILFFFFFFFISCTKQDVKISRVTSKIYNHMINTVALLLQIKNSCNTEYIVYLVLYKDLYLKTYRYCMVQTGISIKKKWPDLTLYFSGSYGNIRIVWRIEDLLVYSKLLGHCDRYFNFTGLLSIILCQYIYRE